MEHDRGRLAGIVLILVLAVGLVSGVLALGGDGGRQMLARFTPGDVADGTATAALSRHLNEDLLGGAALARTARAANWLVLGDLGEQVRAGCAGWLFLREEMDLHPGAASARDRRAGLVAAADRLLKARNIHLTVVVVPDKSRVLAAARCGLPRPAALDARLDRFNAALAAAGVDHLEALPVLAGTAEPYFRSDTHWTEAGAQAVAAALAERLRSANAAPEPGPPVPVTPGDDHERLGDLIRLAGLDRLPTPFRPAGDWVAESRIAMPAVVADDLLGEMAGPPVVVIGSSFSRNGNFIGFLAAALAAPIGDLARDGAGFAGAAEPYFRDAAFTGTPPRAIVWEIPERVLDAPFGTVEETWAARLAAGSL
ncbi:alginate O-acetyltransferase AlgX-related protein [Zavarzinia compransoris]|uniref:Cell division protein FtsQ n=1 Tax=Zavarzinia compransoris TaxID=1264899 RepID=A0A317DZ38_9PROT|nr:cell division protein FtsQ [Zavarzinia compransoris]PWR19979.1 cell division protein FtsQ [Zavarzinia compransoris]TDP44906.1 alginate O-acetyltransferase complex protein AlgJ [Zavarzinia compransoris]